MKRLMLLAPLFLAACSISDLRYQDVDATIAKVQTLLAGDNRLSFSDKQAIQTARPIIVSEEEYAPLYFQWKLPGNRTAIVRDHNIMETGQYALQIVPPDATK